MFFICNYLIFSELAVVYFIYLFFIVIIILIYYVHLFFGGQGEGGGGEESIPRNLRFSVPGGCDFLFYCIILYINTSEPNKNLWETNNKNIKNIPEPENQNSQRVKRPKRVIWLRNNEISERKLQHPYTYKTENCKKQNDGSHIVSRPNS